VHHVTHPELARLVEGEAAAILALFGGIPTIALDYSPMWDANIFEWTQDAIDRGYLSQASRRVPDPGAR
jgi:hypothetical protein